MLLNGTWIATWGKTYSVSATQRLDVEECKDLLAFKDLEGWDVTCLIQISFVPGQMDSVGQFGSDVLESGISGLLALGIFDISECGGASTAKGGTVRTLDDLAENAGWRSHLDGVNIAMI